MVLSRDLLTELRRLSRAEKLQAIRVLINDLAASEEELLIPGMPYEIWSPYDDADAAATLMKLLDEYQSDPANGE
jgi:hypothetical protein